MLEMLSVAYVTRPRWNSCFVMLWKKFQRTVKKSTRSSMTLIFNVAVILFKTRVSHLKLLSTPCRFPFIACEIFTCEIDVILRTLVEDEEVNILVVYSLFIIFASNIFNCRLLTCSLCRFLFPLFCVAANGLAFLICET